MDNEGDWNKPSSQSRDWSCGQESEYPLDLSVANLSTVQSTAQDRSDQMTLPFSNNPPGTLNTLSRHLSMVLVKAGGSKSRSFLPLDQLHALTPSMVKEELRRSMPTLPEYDLDDYTTQIFGVALGDATDKDYLQKPRLLRTFTILVLLDKVETIPSFISGGFADSLLPIDRAHFQGEAVARPSSPSLIALLERCFDNWPLSSIEAFTETQWVVLSPFLAKIDGDVSLYDFEDRTILPILDDGIAVEESFVKIGGNSDVQKVKIHPWHHGFGKDQDGEPYFALKRLHSQRFEDFQREVAALRHFAASPHLHVVKLLTAFRHGACYYLVFPWADGGDLRSLWNENPSPVLDRALLSWVTEQFLGMATALRQIHHERRVLPTMEGENDNSATVSYYGLHGDIKPANILWFKKWDQIDSPYKVRPKSDELLVLGDFGTGRFHRDIGRDGGDRPVGFSPTYRPPELDVTGATSRASDIWSLGCVLLECVTWMLRGREGVGSFALSRVASNEWVDKAGSMDDRYFELMVPIPGSTPKPRLRPSVDEWIDDLARDRGANPYIIDLLNFARNDLLDPDWETRADSSSVVNKLQTLQRKFLEDPAYTVPIPRPRKPPWSNLSSAQDYVDDFLASQSQTEPIDVNMAHVPSLNEMSFTGAMTAPSQATFWSNMDEPSLDISNSIGDAEYFNFPFESAISTEAAMGIFQPHASTEHHTSMDRTTDKGILRNSDSRRRTIDDMTGPNSTGDESRKRMQDQSHGTGDGVPGRSTTNGEEKLFACPFHKRNPAKYKNTYTGNIARYATDAIAALPILKAHRPLIDIIARNCHKAQIQKKPRGISDEEKWRRIYRVIFRLGLAAETPSPYCENIGGNTQTAGGKSDSTDSLADFEAYLHRLGDENNNSNGRDDASAIKSCLDLVQRYQQARSIEQSVPTSDIPSLTFDCSDQDTKTLGSQGLSMSASADDGATSHEFIFANADADELDNLQFCDDSFAAHLGDVFSPNKQYNMVGGLDLGGNYGLLPGG
ncbi:hypothetical protein GGR54DRAFT_652019 [Hypoxylon sp. NC1633]|nr:hypothetical protein GGR54DRAFT_652019 [Hypoxylon sp. NC1633]